mmetsp:Transcript_39295/g.77301  ORF Transcript_39295/g.77301 Transcript_39295/m.77301 type:complete len:244 (+) Transcript_39295:518-1249(+)
MIMMKKAKREQGRKKSKKDIHSARRRTERRLKEKTGGASHTPNRQIAASFLFSSHPGANSSTVCRAHAPSFLHSLLSCAACLFARSRVPERRQKARMTKMLKCFANEEEKEKEGPPVYFSSLPSPEQLHLQLVKEGEAASIHFPSFQSAENSRKKSNGGRRAAGDRKNNGAYQVTRVRHPPPSAMNVGACFCCIRWKRDNHKRKEECHHSPTLLSPPPFSLSSFTFTQAHRNRRRVQHTPGEE